MKQNRGRPRKLIYQQGIEIAQKMFLEYGFDNVSVSELCTKLNCPPTSLYSTYGNKVALFTACLNAYELVFLDRLESALANAESFADLYRNSLESMAEFYLNENQGLGCLIFNGATFCKDPNVIDLVDQKAKLVTHLITARLEEMQSNNVVELAQTLVTLIRGILSSIMAGEDEESVITSIEFFCMTFD